MGEGGEINRVEKANSQYDYKEERHFWCSQRRTPVLVPV